MFSCSVTLSANAGVALCLPGLTIWSDALHEGNLPDFSPVLPWQWEQIRQGRFSPAPDLIFYTHSHPDHCSIPMTVQTVKLFPGAQIISPDRRLNPQILLSSRQEKFYFGEAVLHFFHLTHEGMQYALVPHYGCILSYHNFQILIAGDCAVANRELIPYLETENINLALLDFPWITLRRGRTFLEQYIHPDHLMIYHLPFAEDDRFLYRAKTAESIGMLSKNMDVRILQNPFQRETII